MSKKAIRIISASIALVLVALFIFALFAEVALAPKVTAAQTVDSLNNKLSKLDGEKKKIQKELKNIETKKQSTMTKKAALDQQIGVTQSEIDTINQLISALDQQVKDAQKELDAAKETEKQQYEDFLKRVRVMEEEGATTILGIVLSADDFSDMLTRSELVANIVESDKKLMQELAEARAKIEEKKKEIESAKSQQATAKKKLVNKQNSLENQYSEANSLIKTLNAEAAEYAKAFDEAEKAQAQAKAELKKLLAAAQSSSKAFVGGQFRWPTDATLITSYYGTRTDPITKLKAMHTGVDIGAKMGNNIYASNGGTVIVAGWSSKGYGNYVVIDHGGGMSTLYAHMSKIKVQKGAKVSQGDVVGYVGSTGYSTGPHLHFEILKNGDHTNPMNYFKKA